MKNTFTRLVWKHKEGNYRVFIIDDRHGPITQKMIKEYLAEFKKDFPKKSLKDVEFSRVISIKYLFHNIAILDIVGKIPKTYSLIDKADFYWA